MQRISSKRPCEGLCPHSVTQNYLERMLNQLEQEAEVREYRELSAEARAKIKRRKLAPNVEMYLSVLLAAEDTFGPDWRSATSSCHGPYVRQFTHYTDGSEAPVHEYQRVCGVEIAAKHVLVHGGTLRGITAEPQDAPHGE